MIYRFIVTFLQPFPLFYFLTLAGLFRWSGKGQGGGGSGFLASGPFFSLGFSLVASVGGFFLGALWWGLRGRGVSRRGRRACWSGDAGGGGPATGPGPVGSWATFALCPLRAGRGGSRPPAPRSRRKGREGRDGAGGGRVVRWLVGG